MSILKEADAGRPVNELWRQHGISSATYYKWKAKYGGLEASDVKGLKELQGKRGRESFLITRREELTTNRPPEIRQPEAFASVPTPDIAPFTTHVAQRPLVRSFDGASPAAIF